MTELVTPGRDDPPSTYAIAALVDGEPGALGRVIELTLTRTVLIAPGLYLVGIRDPMSLVKATLGATASITVGLALVYWWSK